jgi:hypothetical protein
MCLDDGDVTLIIGEGLGQGGVLQPSVGRIKMQAQGSSWADSYFDVFFEIKLEDGTLLYNYQAMRLSAVINCIVPQAEYIHEDPCIYLYDAPVGGTHVANLVEANHEVHVDGVPVLRKSWGDLKIIFR